VLLTSPSIEVEDDDSAEAIRVALDEEYIDTVPEPVSPGDARSGRWNIIEATAAALRAADAAKDDDRGGARTDRGRLLCVQRIASFRYSARANRTGGAPKASTPSW
jgi:hypothetical protein